MEFNKIFLTYYSPYYDGHYIKLNYVDDEIIQFILEYDDEFFYAFKNINKSFIYTNNDTTNAQMLNQFFIEEPDEGEGEFNETICIIRDFLFNKGFKEIYYIYQVHHINIRKYFKEQITEELIANVMHPRNIGKLWNFEDF